MNSLKENSILKYLSVAICTLLLTNIILADEKVEKSCTKDIIIGTWVLSVSKNSGNVPDSYSDLIEPYQMLKFGIDNKYSKLSSKNALSVKQMTDLLNFPSEEAYDIDGSKILIKDGNSQTIDVIDCSFFFNDAPKIGIKKNTLSLLWFYQDKPIILNTYTKVSK
ncbi:hypothetical protein EHQ52_15420 [Leptospira koniambonensis]|uniref:Uncharacterized protein n=1 Tax=Leptospira koniambonensis TaxID=2484950 RepID=A0A4V3JMY0_9LEPT|nr:hypothetical protein [Leptospira koniambonensis]TGL31325.1 hypothetical protein EHQ52_15420 [Leptospira koniambonensis]